MLDRCGIPYETKVSEWTDENIAAINKIIADEIKVEGELRSEVQMNIKRLQDIGCFRGIRHRKGLPLRGQRTKTNSRTRKGRRKTIAGKKKVTR
jgi:small subunit ribosomal protein S13